MEYIADNPIPAEIDNPQWGVFYKRIKQIQKDSKKFKLFIDYLFNNLKLRPGSRVLEVGAGVGIYSLQLAYNEILCTDLDIVKANTTLVNYLSKSYNYNNINLNIILGDSCNLPFKDSHFDAIFSTSCFEHIKDQTAALDEQIRVLRKGGRLLIIDGNILCPITLLHMLIIRPRITQGRQGGLKWLFNRSKVYPNYGLGWPGKDEDIKSVFYWKKLIKNKETLKLISIDTQYPITRRTNFFLLMPFLGSVVVLAEKVI